MILDVKGLLTSDKPSKYIPRDAQENLRFRNELFAWMKEEGEPAQKLVMDWCRRETKHTSSVGTRHFNPALWAIGGSETDLIKGMCLYHVPVVTPSTPCLILAR